MAWGTSWDKAIGEDIGITPELLGVKDEAAKTASEQNFRVNLVPTHDPYTNPNAFLYYECECGKRLDPRTKSFASLNNAAMNADWKVRWGPNSYVPYCPKCVEEKGIE